MDIRALPLILKNQKRKVQKSPHFSMHDHSKIQQLAIIIYNDMIKEVMLQFSPKFEISATSKVLSVQKKMLVPTYK